MKGKNKWDSKSDNCGSVDALKGKMKYDKHHKGKEMFWATLCDTTFLLKHFGEIEGRRCRGKLRLTKYCKSHKVNRIQKVKFSVVHGKSIQ